jgi:hypothetical protein
MSDEERKDEETEVEAHSLGSPPRGMPPRGRNEEPSDEGDVEAHVFRGSPPRG